MNVIKSCPNITILNALCLQKFAVIWYKQNLKTSAFEHEISHITRIM